MRLAAAIVLMLLPLSAQEKKEDSKKQPPPPPANLKVLNVKTGQEVMQVMRTFTVGLGVQCTYCHVQGNFASDENPKKETARHMIRMTQEINSKFPDNKMHVSCYTCHRGEAEPKTGQRRNQNNRQPEGESTTTILPRSRAAAHRVWNYAVMGILSSIGLPRRPIRIGLRSGTTREVRTDPAMYSSIGYS